MLRIRDRIARSGLVVVAVSIGLAGVPCGCGSGGSTSQGGAEKVPASVEQMKNIMKERAASLKARKGGVPGKR
jgi:hypothetical protein